MGTKGTEKLFHRLPYNEYIYFSYITVVFHTNGIIGFGPENLISCGAINK